MSHACGDAHLTRERKNSQKLEEMGYDPRSVFFGAERLADMIRIKHKKRGTTIKEVAKCHDVDTKIYHSESHVVSKLLEENGPNLVTSGCM